MSMSVVDVVRGGGGGADQGRGACPQRLRWPGPARPIRAQAGQWRGPGRKAQEVPRLPGGMALAPPPPSAASPPPPPPSAVSPSPPPSAASRRLQQLDHGFIQTALENDAQFFAANQIMDYSLLLLFFEDHPPQCFIIDYLQVCAAAWGWGHAALGHAVVAVLCPEPPLEPAQTRPAPTPTHPLRSPRPAPSHPVPTPHDPR